MHYIFQNQVMVILIQCTFWQVMLIQCITFQSNSPHVCLIHILTNDEVGGHKTGSNPPVKYVY